MSVEPHPEMDTKPVNEDASMTLAGCPVRTTLDVLRGKWKPLILFFLKPGVRRYTDLRAHIPEAPERVFIQQLRELERDQVVDRLVHPGPVPHVEYRISSYGETLMAILQQMADWGLKHRARNESDSTAIDRTAGHP
jgi:DNA-binding HxlR family transcriptional regulator